MPRIIPQYTFTLDPTCKAPREAHSGRCNKTTGTRVRFPTDSLSVAMRGTTKGSRKQRFNSVSARIGKMLKEQGL